MNRIELYCINTKQNQNQLYSPSKFTQTRNLLLSLPVYINLNMPYTVNITLFMTNNRLQKSQNHIKYMH